MEKDNLFLLSIVAIVAIVGIVVMILSTGPTSENASGTLDSAGQAARAITATESIPYSMPSYCTDSDNGTNYNVKGKTTAGNTTKIDYCRSYNSSILVEYFCEKIKIDSEDYSCPNGCANGACKQPPRCGDGNISNGEECDGNTPTNASWGNVIRDCTDFGFTGGILTCNNNCAFDTSGCTTPAGPGVCGDEVLNTGEQCDGNNWGSITDCQDFGFTGGTLRCTSCTFDTRNCTAQPACTDSDKTAQYSDGINYYVKGQVVGPIGPGEGSNGWDYCYTPANVSGGGGIIGVTGTNLLEWYCTSSSSSGQSIKVCNCNDGKCVNQTNTLSRSFSANPAAAGSFITVTLTKTLQVGQNTIFVEEYVNKNFTIVGIVNGTNTTGNIIRWAELSNVKSGNYTYTVRAPNAYGTYAFSGVYTVNGGLVTPINGSKLITVQSQPKPDLYAEDILFVSTYGNVTLPNNITVLPFYVFPKVRNLGNVSVNANAFYNRITFGNMTSTYTKCSPASYMILPGASYTCKSDYVMRNPPTRTYTVSIGVDYYNTVPETNENNNVRTEVISVLNL